MYYVNYLPCKSVRVSINSTTAVIETMHGAAKSPTPTAYEVLINFHPNVLGLTLLTSITCFKHHTSRKGKSNEHQSEER